MPLVIPQRASRLIKPRPGVRVTSTHPLGQGLVRAFVCSEGGGHAVYCAAGSGVVGTAYSTDDRWAKAAVGPAIIADNTGTGTADGSRWDCGVRGWPGPNVGPYSIFAGVWLPALADTAIVGASAPSGIEWRVDAAGTLTLLRQAAASQATSTGTIAAATWVDIGVTYAVSGAIRFYKNGIDIGGGSNAQTYDFTTSLWLGAGNSEVQNGLLISYVYFYNRVVQPSEAFALARGKYSMFAPPAWQRWPMGVPAGGATQYTIDITGTVTPTGAIVKQVGLHLAGSETPAGALIKRVGKTLSGTVTPAGALVDRVGKVFVGTVTPAGALVKRTGKVFTGSFTPAGALVKQVGLHVAGTLTPVGSIVKQVGVHLTGSETPAGTLAALKVAILNTTGTVTPAGALLKRVGKIFAGTVTPAGALVKQVGLHLSGTVTPAGALAALKVAIVNATGTVTPVGALVKQVGLHLAGTITPAGALLRQLGLHLVGSLTPAGALVRQAGKVMAGTVTPAGALTALKVAIVNAAGTVTPAGALVKQTSLHLSGTVTPAGALVKQVGQTLAGAVSSIVGALVNVFIAGGTPTVTGPFTVEATAYSLYAGEGTAYAIYSGESTSQGGSMTPLGWRIYYGDGTIRSSRQGQGIWQDAPSTNVQFVAIIYAETYQRSVQDGYDEQGTPINQHWITEHYMDTFKGCDYYWFLEEMGTGGGTNISAEVPAGALVKLGKSMPDPDWHNLLAYAQEQRQAP